MQRIQDENFNYGKVFNFKDQYLNHLKDRYTSIGHPIAFSGVNKIYDYYRGALSREDIQNFLSSVENYTLHREFHQGQRNPSYSHFKRYQFQCDLVDIQSLSSHNDDVKYLFTCIDTFTRYAFVRLLRSKHGIFVLEAFKSVLEEAIQQPQTLVLDRGTEFYNEPFKRFCQDRNINLFSPDSSIHGAYIERFNRSLQDIIYRYMTENETRRFIDRLNEDGTRTNLMPLFLSTYNNRKHRMIGVTPYTAENDESSHLQIRKKLAEYYQKIKKGKVQFNVGDYVRISKLKGKFDRGYNERAEQEIFKIHSIKTNLKIPLYTLSNYNGTEIIKGSFYAFELTKTTGDTFRVERVIRRRIRNGREQLFVKWKGFDNTHNSWIDADQVTQRF